MWLSCITPAGYAQNASTAAHTAAITASRCPGSKAASTVGTGPTTTAAADTGRASELTAGPAGAAAEAGAYRADAE